jgi:hypothetical protein
LSRLFISHSARNNSEAIALRDWLAEQGFDDVFLDIDPDRGLAPGECWQEALKAAADRCEAVLFLVSPAWLDSRWCLAEFLLAKTLHKRIFGLIIEPVPFERLPAEMTAEWQLCELVGEDRFRTFRIQSVGEVIVSQFFRMRARHYDEPLRREWRVVDLEVSRLELATFKYPTECFPDARPPGPGDVVTVTRIDRRARRHREPAPQRIAGLTAPQLLFPSL